MNVIEAIHCRHSYRGKYKNIPVPKDDLIKIMQAGLDAPSGCNKQTTSLIAVDDPLVLEKCSTSGYAIKDLNKFIEEFKNGQFKYICPTCNGKLNLPGIDNFDLTHFDFETKSLYLSDRESPEKIKLTWNPETEFYEKEILQK